MNATSLYVSTCRLVMQANADDPTSWADLYRLVPYLRQSLSCTVCGNLLIEPYTPTETSCQHHVCKSCKGGKKKLKPSCSWCKDFDKYIENVQLRILLQCYKKLCEYIISSAIHKKLSTVNISAGNNINTNLLDGTTPTLMSLIQEGAGFADEFGSSRTSNFLLSCFHTNSTSTQTISASTSTQTNSGPIIGLVTNPDSTLTPFPSNGETENVKPVHNGSTVYSVLYAGSGNKLTIKRKASESLSENHDSSTLSPVKALSPPPKPPLTQTVQPPPNSGITPVKKQTRGKSASSGVVKTGCRCGNATAVPGKLTCCGQRCACYTESKPCVDCKCRGCRNPHTADGQKVCNYQLLEDPLAVPQCVSLTSNDLITTAGGTVQVVGVYTTQLHNLTSTPLLLDANTAVTTLGPEETTSDVDVGI